MTANEPQQPCRSIPPAEREKERQLKHGLLSLLNVLLRSCGKREAIESAFIHASFVRHARWKLMKVFMKGSDVIIV